jgi:hypothetical protein
MHNVYAIIQDLKQTDDSEEIEQKLLGIPENSIPTYMVADRLGLLTNAETKHFSILVEKSHPKALPKLSAHIPFKKLAKEGDKKELNEIANLACQMYEACLKYGKCKSNAKCQDPCSRQHLCGKHDLTKLIRNTRKKIISQFNLHILEIDEDIHGVITRDIPRLHFKKPEKETSVLLQD